MTEMPQSGRIFVETVTGVAAATATLRAPGAGMSNKILWVCCYATTATAVDLDFQNNAGSSFVRLGGTGTALLNGPIVFTQDPGPNGGLPMVANNATKVVLTAAGAGACALAVGYTMCPSS